MRARRLPKLIGWPCMLAFAVYQDGEPATEVRLTNAYVVGSDDEAEGAGGGPRGMAALAAELELARLAQERLGAAACCLGIEDLCRGICAFI